MVNPNELLPLEAVSLVNIPAEHKAKYKPKLSGDGHYLAYLADTDTREIAAYNKEIRESGLTVMLNGETPESLAKAAADDDASRQEFLKMVEANWNKELDVRKARDEAKLKEMQDAINANYDRWRRQ